MFYGTGGTTISAFDMLFVTEGDALYSLYNLFGHFLDNDPLKKSCFDFMILNDELCFENKEKKIVRILVFEIWSI